MHMMHRLRQGKQTESKIKMKLREFVEGKVVTIIMALVTVFALVCDDIRLWITDKNADPYFYSGLLISFILFTTEILLNTVVIDEFKYSFFFWLDIIATLSLIIDITWITDILNHTLVNYPPSYLSANAIPGLTQESAGSNKWARVIKSLRLVRLIRIIKLYKYIVQSGSKNENEDLYKKKKKKRQQPKEEKKEEEEESVFKKETDPSKLGKSLSESINKKTIIGTLLMLMILPLLNRIETDYSGNYALREVFWFGRSNCNDPKGFYCS